jgi:hypothetical protein
MEVGIALGARGRRGAATAGPGAGGHRPAPARNPDSPPLPSGVQGAWSPGGLGPSAAVGISARWRLCDRLPLLVDVGVPFVSSELEAPEGKASIRWWTATLGARLALLAGRSLEPGLSLKVGGVSLAEMVGTGNPPYVGQVDQAFAARVALGLDLRWATLPAASRCARMVGVAFAVPEVARPLREPARRRVRDPGAVAGALGRGGDRGVSRSRLAPMRRGQGEENDMPTSLAPSVHPAGRPRRRLLVWRPHRAARLRARPLRGPGPVGPGGCAVLDGQPVCVFQSGFRADALACVPEGGSLRGPELLRARALRGGRGRGALVCGVGFHASGLECAADVPGAPSARGVTCSWARHLRGPGRTPRPRCASAPRATTCRGTPTASPTADPCAGQACSGQGTPARTCTRGRRVLLPFRVSGRGTHLHQGSGVDAGMPGEPGPPSSSSLPTHGEREQPGALHDLRGPGAQGRLGCQLPAWPVAAEGRAGGDRGGARLGDAHRVRLRRVRGVVGDPGVGPDGQEGAAPHPAHDNNAPPTSPESWSSCRRAPAPPPQLRLA